MHCEENIWPHQNVIHHDKAEAESCLLINLHPLRLFSVVVRVGTGEAEAPLPPSPSLSPLF